MQTWKKIGKIALLVLALVIVAAAIYAARLIYPGTPSSTANMKFEGYILLPKGGNLSVLDYVTIVKNDLFVTAESDGSVFKVGLRNASSPAEATVQTFPGNGAAHGVVIDPVSHIGFVTRSESNTVDVFDPERLTLLKQIPVPDDDDAIFYDPSSQLIYVGSGDAHVVTLIDPAKQEVAGSIPLSGKPEFAAFDPAKKLFYQNLEDKDTVALVDTSKKAVVKEWLLPECQGPTPMAIDAPNRRLFLGCGGNAKFVVLDLESQRVVATLDIGAHPDSIAYDADLHRLYVTGKAGVLSVIAQKNADSYETLDSISTHYGAHTLAVDPATHRVYVAYAGLLVAPRLAVFTPKQ